MRRVSGNSTRWAILNGFGISLGDSVIGLQALWAAMQLGAVASPPVLFRKPGLRRMVDKIYPLAADFCSVAALPETLTLNDPALSRFGHVVDMRDFAFDPRFRCVAMIDFFLDRLGLDAGAVPAALKRNVWLAARTRPIVPDFGRGYVLVCPASSMSLRDMPQGAHARLLEWLLKRGKTVVTQGRPPDELAERVRCVGALETPDALCGLVANAACMIATDTAMVHLADAFDVPSLAFFTTHRPEWRVRDYPTCRPVHLPAIGLPDALEFMRGPADLAATQDAWSARGADFAWLDGLLQEFVG